MPGIKQVDVLIIVAAQEVTAIVRVHQACDVGSPDLTAGRELEKEGEEEERRGRRRSGGGGVGGGGGGGKRRGEGSEDMGGQRKRRVSGKKGKE